MRELLHQLLEDLPQVTPPRRAKAKKRNRKVSDNSGAISDEDFFKIAKHLDAKGMAGCPICGAKRWSIAGPVAPHLYDPATKTIRDDASIPLVLVICDDCSFVRTFAWNLIREPKAER